MLSLQFSECPNRCKDFAINPITRALKRIYDDLELKCTSLPQTRPILPEAAKSQRNRQTRKRVQAAQVRQLRGLRKSHSIQQGFAGPEGLRLDLPPARESQESEEQGRNLCHCQAIHQRQATLLTNGNRYASLLALRAASCDSRTNRHLQMGQAAHGQRDSHSRQRHQDPS